MNGFNYVNDVVVTAKLIIIHVVLVVYSCDLDIIVDG